MTSQFFFSFSAVFAPTPGHRVSSRVASGESNTSNVLAPKCVTSLSAVTFPHPGSAPPERYRSIAGSSVGGASSSGEAFKTNCVPHFSSSRQSPVSLRFRPSATLGMYPVIVITASFAPPAPPASFLVLRF